MTSIPIPENIQSPTLNQVIEKQVSLALAGMHVSCPGQVQSFDPATGTASIKPLIQDSSKDEDGNRVYAPLPIVNMVTVQFPGAGKFRITFPVQVGDLGLLVFGDRSYAEWIASPVTDTLPADTRRHALSDAVFLPGAAPSQWTIDPAQGTVGMEGGPQAAFSDTEIAFDDGVLAVARETDTVDADPAFVTWMAGVISACAANTPTIVITPLAGATIGEISSGAPRVKA